jgi:hypothetical protein
VQVPLANWAESGLWEIVFFPSIFILDGIVAAIIPVVFLVSDRLARFCHLVGTFLGFVLMMLLLFVQGFVIAFYWQTSRVPDWSMAEFIMVDPEPWLGIGSILIVSWGK